jgi:PAS domain S-box-containing protein
LSILIAKDGREIPIDDSGSPIKKDNGEIFGVVLVFREISKDK